MNLARNDANVAHEEFLPILTKFTNVRQPASGCPDVSESKAIEANKSSRKGIQIILKHEKSTARIATVKFLYQCERENIYYYSNSHFKNFCLHFGVEHKKQEHAMTFAQGVFDQLDRIDKELANASEKWPISRMSSIDRSVLRLAIYELLASQEPVKVILNEAIEIAKEYGTEHSGKFVNGILDAIAKNKR